MRSRAVRRVSYRGMGLWARPRNPMGRPGIPGEPRPCRSAVRFGTRRRLMYVSVVSRCRFAPVRHVSMRVRPPPPSPLRRIPAVEKMLTVIICRTHTCIIPCDGVSGHLFKTVGTSLQMYCESTNFPPFPRCAPWRYRTRWTRLRARTRVNKKIFTFIFVKFYGLKIIVVCFGKYVTFITLWSYWFLPSWGVCFHVYDGFFFRFFSFGHQQ